MKDDFFDNIEVSAELDRTIETSVRAAVLKKKRKRMKNFSLSIAVFILGNIFFLNTNSFANTKDFFISIASYFSSSNDLDEYKASIGSSISNEGYTITINEALVDENELIVSSTIKSDSGTSLDEQKFQATILVNNKKLSYDSDEMLERKDSSTINSISTYRFKEALTKNSNIEIQYQPLITNEKADFNKIEGSWNFNFNVNPNVLKETSATVKIDKVVNLTHNISMKLTEYKGNMFRSKIKTSVTGDISSLEVKLIGSDNLGNKCEFIVDRLYLDENLSGFVTFALDNQNSNINTNATSLTLYPYSKPLDSNEEFEKLNDSIIINLK